MSAARAPGRPRSAVADAAIARATLEALREEGFRGLSVESVRQRSGVGKATIYRRYPDKESLVRAAIASLNPTIGELPDTGSVRGDMLAIFRLIYQATVDRQGATFAPRLLAESATDPEMHAIFREALIDPRREAVRRVLLRGIERGELPQDTDLELVIDMIAGPVIYRVLVDGGTLEGVADRLEPLIDTVLYGVAR